MVNENPTNPETINELVELETAEQQQRANRPMIDHLPDAIERDELGRSVLNAKPGEKLIIERWATILKNRPWLDTKTYTIISIDEATGHLKLWDDDLQRNAATNYIDGVKAGYKFKLPTRKGMQIGKKKRGRPKKNPTDAPTVEAAKPSSDGPKKRGRPAGSKNRDREVIAAEKKAKVEKKKAKRKKK